MGRGQDSLAFLDLYQRRLGEAGYADGFAFGSIRLRPAQAWVVLEIIDITIQLTQQQSCPQRAAKGMVVEAVAKESQFGPVS